MTASAAVERKVLLDWVEPRIARIAINRPQKRNACDQQSWREIAAALEQAARQSARLAILTGEGEHFCAGDDIKDAAAARQDPARWTTYGRDMEQAFLAIAQAPFPVIAAVSGYCIGGGLNLAMSCDFRIGTPSVELGIPAAKLGFTYPAWHCARLMTLIGLTEARRMLFVGDRIDGQRAHAVGLLDVLTDADPVAAALAFGAGMVDGAPLSIQASKRIFQALAVGDLPGHRAEIDELMRGIDASADRREGAAAFAEKRRPNFTGR